MKAGRGRGQLLLRAAILLATIPGCRSGSDGEVGEPAPTDLFVDVAQEVGLRFVHFNGMSGELYMPEMMGGGVALFDYDNDGDLDVYLVQGGMLGPEKTLADALFPSTEPSSLGDRLFRNDLSVDADGVRRLRFTDVTDVSGIAGFGYGMGVATGDADGDGWMDLYVTNLGHNDLWRNRGDGTFEEVAMRAGVDDERWNVAAAFVDFDRDGLLDLFVGSYLDFRFTVHKKCVNRIGRPDYCSPQVYGAQPDRLFHNQGDGRFEEVSARANITSRASKALGVVPADFDLDGWIDLYVANDGVPNHLWMNQRDGTFREEALLRGCAVNAAGAAEASMGVDAADFDEDGDEDLFMTHLAEETNTLFRSTRSGLFEDATVATGLVASSLGKTGFGAGWLDYDNDGWLDLLVVNGAVQAVPAQLRAGEVYPLREPNQLYHNRGDGTLEEVTESAGAAFELSQVSRGAAFGDIDNDGDVDVLVVNNAGPVRLLRNDVGNESAWLGLRLTDASGRDMLGALAVVTNPSGVSRRRRVRTAGSYASASDPRILVGLDSAEPAHTVTVHWPDGSVERWDDVPAGRYTTLRVGEGRPARGELEVAARPQVRSAPEPMAESELPQMQGPAPEVPWPDPSSFDGPVRDRIEAQRGALERLERDGRSAPAELAQAYGEIGRLYHATYFHRAAEACYRHALERQPESFVWQYYLALLLEDDGQLHRAAHAYAEALRLRPRDLATVLRLGNVQLQLGRRHEARRQFERALALDQRSAAAHYGLGRTLAADGEREQAISHYEAALTLDPGAGSIRYALMLTLRDLGRFDEARRFAGIKSGAPVRFRDPLKQALYSVDLGARAPDTLARQALSMGQFEKAASYYRQRIDDAPSDRVAHSRLAQALEGLGRAEEAELHARTAVRLDPSNLNARFRLARLLSSHDPPTEAIDLLQRLLQEDPGYTEGHYLMVQLLLRSGRPAQALPHLDSLLEANPGHALSWLTSARILFQLGRVDGSLAKLERAHRTMPADPEIAHTLARLLVTMPETGPDDIRRAVELARSITARDPSPKYAETMALALARAGDVEEAIRWQQQLVAHSERAGDSARTERLRANLAQFERGERVSVPELPP